MFRERAGRSRSICQTARQNVSCYGQLLEKPLHISNFNALAVAVTRPTEQHERTSLLKPAPRINCGVHFQKGRCTGQKMQMQVCNWIFYLRIDFGPDLSDSGIAIYKASAAAAASAAGCCRC
jgi:hypothetical protein